ncbi:MAG: maltotransferase domain-containing protein [Gammaproteobacteria bacterium]
MTRARVVIENVAPQIEGGRFAVKRVRGDDSRSLILTLTYFVVVFSILVQGLTLGRVLRRTRRSSVG